MLMVIVLFANDYYYSMLFLKRGVGDVKKKVLLYGWFLCG
jgi:hypothetical protein